MTRVLLVAGISLFGLVGAAYPINLVSTLSDDAVEITSNFTGERIVVFGAIGDIPQDDTGDFQVAVVVEGPPQDVIVRRKERLLGIWTNLASREFKEAPSYYVMHLSANMSAGFGPQELSGYGLGVISLPFVRDALGEPAGEEFARALVDLREAHELYVERKDAVEFLAPNVFRTTFFLPSDIPTGEYRISVYLFRNQGFLAGDTETLTIVKSGFSDRIAYYANEEPLAYGFVCVALALLTGWFAGVIFRRP